MRFTLGWILWHAMIIWALGDKWRLWLRSRGIRVGDRVALHMPNTPDYLALFYAIWHLGAVAVPVNAGLHAKEAAWVFENAGARLAFVEIMPRKSCNCLPNSQPEILVLPKPIWGIVYGSILLQLLHATRMI